VPGSVMAMAVTVSPDTMPGSHRARWSVVAGEEVRDDDVGLQTDRGSGRAHSRSGVLLGHHGVEPKVGHATPAVLGGMAIPMNPRLAASTKSDRSTTPCGLPFGVVGDDLGVDEIPDALSEELVVLCVQRASHPDSRR
jgi:hypothetical protein